jgi:hypothetical protein
MKVKSELHALAALAMGENVPNSHSKRGWMGSRADEDAVLLLKMEFRLLG